jgi:hypothetical protein
MTADITLHIERLVIDGEVLDGADRRAVAEEVRAGLGELLVSRGLPTGLEDGATLGTVRGGSLAATGALGTRIAGAVHAGLTSTAARPTGDRP